MPTQKKLKVISLFSGAGGLDIGFKQAGFEIAVCVEHDPSCADTLRANMKSVPVICGDLRKITTEEILKAAKLKPLDAAMVIGGPPCQPFSLAGKREGLADARGTLFHEFVRVIREALPHAFLMENVKGLLNWNNGEASKLIQKELSSAICFSNKKYQYKLSFDCVNAADYGVPQKRERVFFIGNRSGIDFKFPPAKYFDPDRAPLMTPHYNTAGMALAGLPKPDAPSEIALRISKTIKKRHERLGYE